MIQDKTFIEVEYTGRLKDDNKIFDTTNEELAKKEGIHNKNASYGPVVVCVGQGQLVKGIEEELKGKKEGKYIFDLKPENAFGKKSTQLIQLMPTSKLLKEKIQPVPGLQLNIDGNIAIVRSVSGGRTVVDFNHPLAGKEVVYEVEVKRILTDPKEKIEGLLGRLGLETSVEVKDRTAEIKTKNEIPKESQEELKKYLKELVEVEINFVTGEHKNLNTV
ncbi:peptidylprolyl isomerase [archaeon]|nr:peptidylprolyl isomerase [archaeon]